MIFFDFFYKFTDDEYNALFRTVEEVRNSLRIERRNSTHIVFPELRKIVCCYESKDLRLQQTREQMRNMSKDHQFPERHISNDRRGRFGIIGNPFLVEVSFPKLKQLVGIRHFNVFGNPRLSDKSVAPLNQLGINFTGAQVRGSGDCAFEKAVESAELSQCTHISYNWLQLRHDFTGEVDTVIRGVDKCIYVRNTSISDLSFINLTTRGKDWDSCNHTITNNRNLCTASIEKMFSSLNASVHIWNNKDPAECPPPVAPPTSTTTTTTVAPPTSTSTTTVAPSTSTTSTTVAPPTSTSTTTVAPPTSTTTTTVAPPTSTSTTTVTPPTSATSLPPTIPGLRYPMDHLSFCPSLPQILSYVTPDDVICCLQLNKRINSVVTNNWKRMKKPVVELTMISQKNHAFIVAELVHYQNDGSSPKKFETLKITKSTICVDYVTSPLLTNRFSQPGNSVKPESDFAPLLREFFCFLLPRIELRNMYLDHPFSEVETRAVMDSFGDFYAGFVPDIVSSENYPLYPELSKLGKTRRLDSHSLGYLDSSHLHLHLD